MLKLKTSLVVEGLGSDRFLKRFRHFRKRRKIYVFGTNILCLLLEGYDTFQNLRTETGTRSSRNQIEPESDRTGTRSNRNQIQQNKSQNQNNNSDTVAPVD
jgi:hypothetical protein